MKSLILRTAAQIIIPLLLIFSVFLLWRGHNQPGGGFTGGLMAATALALSSIAFGPRLVRRALPWEPRMISILGLAFATLAAMLGLFTNQPVMKAYWLFIGGTHAEGGFGLGSPLLFDSGVYLVVVGAVLTIILAMEEEGK